MVDDQRFDDKILVAYHVQYLCTAIFNGQQIIKMVVKKGRTTSRISVVPEYMTEEVVYLQLDEAVPLYCGRWIGNKI